MPRPKRPRHIISRPPVREFRPDIDHEKEEIILSLEEFEAIRLIDYDGLDQGQTAEIMNVSRQTVGRVLKAGRYKLAKMIVAAHPLRLGGGCYKVHDGPVPGHRGRGRGRGGKGRGFGPGRGRKLRPEILKKEKE